MKQLSGEVVWLRPPELEDWRAWADLRRMSRSFLEPYEPTWPDDCLSQEAFARRTRTQYIEMQSDFAWHYLIFSTADQALLGGISITNIRRGMSQSGILGYWIGAPYAQKGYMSDALKAVCRFAFERLDLHRLNAATLPQNEASRRLLFKNGFEEEGLAKSYLKINGLWQDHVLYGRVKPSK